MPKRLSSNLTVTNGDVSLSVDPKSGKYTVDKGGFIWINEGRSAHVLLQKKLFGKYCSVARFALYRAKSVTHRVEDNRIISEYSGFCTIFGTVDVKIRAVASLLDDGAVDFSVETEGELGCEIASICYPGAFNAKVYDRRKAYSVDCARQGFIWPDGFKRVASQKMAMTSHRRGINCGDYYMPMWGRIVEGRGYSAVLEDAYDAAIFSTRQLLNAVSWLPSLGKMRYTRTVHFKFYDHADYNDCAKAYRAHLIAKGELVTLKDKISQNPNVARLVGRPVIHTKIFQNIQPQSQMYDKRHPNQNQKLFQTFDEKAAMLRGLSQAGLAKAYVHLDGWGVEGYDNHHPYVLPPCAAAGGWQGMKRLADECRAIDYVFGIHDQYRDQYYSSAKFDAAESVVDINGKHPYCDIWDGGAHSWLCAEFAPKYVKHTYQQLADHGVNVEAAYLDVFGIVEGDECFSPNHPLTRKQSIQKRGECFDYLRANGIIASSEEPGALMLNYIDIVHHGPYMVVPQGGGKGMGIPVPLTNLVFHDCVVVPWVVDGEGGWGIPDGDRGSLHCILNAQTPYFDCDYQGDTNAERIAKVSEIAAIQAKLWDKEMLRHEFLDNNYRRQRTTYADGTIITVDFERNEYEIKWANEQSNDKTPNLVNQ